MWIKRLIGRLLKYYRNPLLIKSNRLGLHEDFINNLLVVKNMMKFTPSTIIDVGAATGEWALAANFIFPNANIYAFEPIKESYDILVKKTGKKNINTFCCALAENEGERKFYLAGNSDSSSLLKITNKQMEDFPVINGQKEITVYTDRMDKLLNNSQLLSPVFCKLDVHGADLEVLAGMGDLLSKIDLIQIEILFRDYYEGMPSAIEIIKYLHDNGFKAFYQAGIVMSQEIGNIQFCDLIFQR